MPKAAEKTRRSKKNETVFFVAIYLADAPILYTVEQKIVQ